MSVEYQREQRADKRLDGFRDTFDKAGLKCGANIRLEEEVTFEAGNQGAVQVLETATEVPDFIYFLNDHMAVGRLLE